jgi:hypothetical protein
LRSDSFVANLKDRAKTRHHLLVRAEDHPVGWRLTGSEPDLFALAATRMVVFEAHIDGKYEAKKRLHSAIYCN